MQELDLFKTLFASTYALYNKTQQAHWQLKDKRFVEFHKFFEEHYNNFQEATDDIAEMIIINNGNDCFNLNKIIENSIIDSKISNLDDLCAILTTLIEDHNKLINFINDSYGKTKDLLMQDMYVQRLFFHKKAVWMMSASNKK